MSFYEYVCRTNNRPFICLPINRQKIIGHSYFLEAHPVRSRAVPPPCFFFWGGCLNATKNEQEANASIPVIKFRNLILFTLSLPSLSTFPPLFEFEQRVEVVYLITNCIIGARSIPIFLTVGQFINMPEHLAIFKRWWESW